jgi:hypothetical protein
LKSRNLLINDVLFVGRGGWCAIEYASHCCSSSAPLQFVEQRYSQSRTLDGIDRKGARLVGLLPSLLLYC